MKLAGTPGGAAAAARRRLLHIDVARGLSIALVVFSHGPLRHLFDGLNTVLASFRMPLFFLLAGLFLRSGVAAGPWLRGRTDALLKPYAVTLAAYCLARWLAGRHDPGSYYLGLLEGNGRSLPETFIPLWFLPHLWLVLLWSWALLRLTRMAEWPPAAQMGLLGLMFGAGIGLLGMVPPLPWGLDLILVSGSFVLAGALMQGPMHALRRHSVPQLALLLASGGGVLVCMHLLGPASVDLNLRRWDDPLRSTLGAASGILAALALAALIARLGRRRWPARALAALGRHSLVILLFHYIVQAYGWKALEALLPGRAGLNASLAYLGALVVPLALARHLIGRWPRLAALWLPSPRARPRAARREPAPSTQAHAHTAQPA